MYLVYKAPYSPLNVSTSEAYFAVYVRAIAAACDAPGGAAGATMVGNAFRLD